MSGTITYGINENSPAFNHTPLTALSTQTRQQLAKMLNCKKILRSEEGYERDWRGIAALSQQKYFCDEAAIVTDNPIEKVLQFWIRNNPQSAKIGYLELFLGTIDRWDVCDDIYENLQKDTEVYKTNQQKKAVLDNLSRNLNEFDHFGQDVNVVTDDDVNCLNNGLPLQQYDAFVLYADADINLATDIIAQLENPRYNFKLYLKDRDMLGGIRFEHVELTRLIEERCKHLIVVLTEEFLRSPENAFLVNYTQALQIHNNVRKIIPIIYKANMIIPKTLKIYTHLKYNCNGLFNFWDKLAKSLQDINVLTTYYVRDMQAPTQPTAPEQEVTPLTNFPGKPRIVINDYDEKEKDKNVKKDKKFLKQKNRATVSNLYSLRQTRSVGQLNVAESQESLSANSVVQTKKTKEKWRHKLLGKVLRSSSSSSKLQDGC